MTRNSAPLVNTGPTAPVPGMTLSQVRGLRLPAGGGELTLSLPYEASIDRLAQAALERARANGWELTLQYAEADVPAGYRRLDFLESTGEQHIDTGYIPNSNTSMVCTAMPLEKELVFRVLFGVRQGYLVQSFICFSNQTTSEPTVSLRRGGEQISWVVDCFGQITTYSITPSAAILNGNISAQWANPHSFEEAPTSLVLGAGRSVQYIIYPFVGRIYSAKISEGTEIACEFIPCISPDGKLGMYNRVDGTLKENAGSGQFIAGLATVDDVRKLWLPETGGELTVSVPSDTPDSAVEQLRKNNPSWQIAIQYRTDNENQ